MNVSPLFAPIEVYRYQGPSKPPTLSVSTISGIVDKTDSVALQTYNAAVQVVKYYQSEYNRNSYDNKGSLVKIVVGYQDQPGTPMNNAFWDKTTKTMYFGDGDGSVFSPLGTAPDVIAHEFGHAVIDSAAHLRYSGEGGGLHESVSDIFATGVDGNLKIGEGVYTPNIDGDALRDLEKPKYKSVNDFKVGTGWGGEPHLLSEPLSYAAVLASRSLGIDKVRKVWYTAVVDKMKASSGFIGFRQATESAALSLYGPEARQSISDAWKAVGVIS